MDNPFLQPLRIPVRPSRCILGAILFLHGGALACLLLAALPAWSQLLLTLCVAVSLLRALQAHLLPDATRPSELLLDRSGAWQVVDGRGRMHTAQLCRDALIHPSLIALRLRTGDSVHRVLLTPDNADPDSLRRMRVRLRVQG